MTARPTTLRLLVERCPKAVDYYEEGAPADASVFATGTAAHDVLQTITLYGEDHAGIDATVATLLSVGRAGIDSSPPLPPDNVFAGRDLAVAFVEATGRPQGFPELGLAFLPDWSPVPYEHRDAWFRIRLDLVDVMESPDEEQPGAGIVVRDYKTSWAADASLLDSIQMRAQAVAVATNWRAVGLEQPPDFIRREIANLRTHRIYDATDWLSDGVIERWRADLVQLIEAHDTRPRKARPGVNCIGCDYARICPAARELAGRVPVWREDVGRSYAAAVARAEALETLARRAAAEAPIETPDGRIGFLAKRRQEALPDAWRTLWDKWSEGVVQVDGRIDVGVVRGFLARLDLRVAQVQAAARGILPAKRDSAVRTDLIDRATRTRNVRQFTVERAKPETITDAEPAFIEEDPT